MAYSRKYKVADHTISVDEITPYQYNVTHKIGYKLHFTEVKPTQKEAQIAAYQRIEKLLQDHLNDVRKLLELIQR